MNNLQTSVTFILYIILKTLIGGAQESQLPVASASEVMAFQNLTFCVKIYGLTDLIFQILWTSVTSRLHQVGWLRSSH